MTEPQQADPDHPEMDVPLDESGGGASGDDVPGNEDVDPDAGATEPPD